LQHRELMAQDEDLDVGGAERIRSIIQPSSFANIR
jgi:hypothetical protein